jgi:hypothetical protein
MVRSHRYDIEPLHQFAKPAPDAITLGSAAVLLGNGEPDPDRPIVAAQAALYHEGMAVGPRTIGNGEKVRPLPQPIHNEISGRSGSGAQTLAAARTARGEDVAAAGRGETSAEAVTALAHQFAGLISPLHG